MSVDTPTIIDLLRHGEPAGGRKYRGWTDDPLTDLGWAQMRKAARPPYPWDALITSPLLRCREFAEDLSRRAKLPLVVDDRLKEVGFGEWEGQTAEAIEAVQPGALKRFYQSPAKARPPNAEPLADFQARVSIALSDILRTYAEQHVLVITHAGVIRAAIGHTLHAPLHATYRTIVDYAGLTRLKHTDERPLSLAFHNQKP